MNTIDEIVAAICPNMPKDRKIIPTLNREMWYKIDLEQKILFVPYDNVLRYSEIEIDKFSESLHNFEIFEAWQETESWDHLCLTYCTEEKDCLELLESLMYDSILAVDIESCHLNYDNNKILLIGFAWSGASAASISCFTQPVLVALQKLFSNPDITFVWQGGKFDISRLKYVLGIDARVDEDTMLLHYVGINERRGTHGLKEMAKLYLQAPAWEDEKDQYRKEWARKNKVLLENFTFDLLPIEILRPYNLKDCIATYRLWQLYKRLARPECKIIYRKLIEASNVIAQVQLNGIGVDIEYLSELADKLCGELAVAEDKCNVAIGHLWDAHEYVMQSGAKAMPTSFNLSSPKQLKWIIEKAIGHAIKDTNDETLTEIFASESNDFITVLKELRKLSKKVDTYITGMDKAICKDGRIRGTYNLHGTETGRLSCTNPNMQNIPREAQIKNIFKAADGYKFVQLDYSQAELRVLAVLSGDPNMKKVYIEDGDLHAYTAAKLFGENFTKEQRDTAKPVNFGVVYGLTAKELAKDLGISVQDAAKLMYEWNKLMPVAKRFIQSKRQEPINGIESVTPFGRTRHFIITDKNYYHIQNEAINTPIQSIASDLTLFALLEIHEYIKYYRHDAKIVATVHDSILLEVKDDEKLNEIAHSAKNIMENVPKLFWHDVELVPFRADIEIGYSWGDLHKYESD